MRMKNRFSRMGKTLLGAAGLLSICSVTYSCSDDFDLDERRPDFLKASIYDELKANGNFTTVVRLIEDMDYADVLSKTGSKTLFVADDNAYAKFFETTDWVDGNGNPVRSYDQLSVSQKRYLINNAMLDNAYVMEMMANTEGGGKNLCLRQVTSATAVDTVRFWKYDELPINYNEGRDGETPDVRYWDKYRDMSRFGIYMALDATRPMMTHFLDGQMREKNITHSDVAFIMNDPNGWAEDGENRSYIYNRRVIEADVTCLNGYYHVLDSVLLAPSNMAEMIRTNGSTNLFSHILDRFSAPYYNSTLTTQYRQLHDIGTDSVFEKRYISMRSQGGAQLSVGPDQLALPGSTAYLSFDPGWNEYNIVNEVKEADMGVMFVPNDEALSNYFLTGGGRALLERYAPDASQSLEYRVDQIPLRIIRALVNNLMKASFNESVPSKYRTIMNDARDRMFSGTDYPDEESFRRTIDKCILANNGLIYVMNTVISPADYASVAGPVLFSEETKVMQTVISADDDYISGSMYAYAPLQQYYSTLLKSMQSRFSFFVPKDEGLATYGYVDPAGWARGGTNVRYWRFTKDDNFTPVQGSYQIAVQAVGCAYNIETGAQPTDEPNTALVSRPSESLNSNYGQSKKAMLLEMVDQHIVVHGNSDLEGMDAPQNYYLSRKGAPVLRIAKGGANGVGMLVNGGLQQMLKSDEYPANDFDCEVVESYDMTNETNGYGNGMTYMIDRPMQPTMKSVYAIMTGDADHYSEFFNQCEYYSDDLLEAAGLKETLLETLNSTREEKDKLKEVSADQWTNEKNKYRVFTDQYNAQRNEMLVRFFNNYRYTIYVPTNEAMQEAYSKGLPTWEDIEAFVYDENNQEDGVLTPENKQKAQAMITMLANFLKYHFQDQSVFVDNVTNEGATYQTSCIDSEKNMYVSLTVDQTPNALSVTDATNHKVNVVAPYNILANDMQFNARGTDTSCRYVSTTSYVVIHQVPEALNFAELQNGRYDAAWATAAKARAFVSKYRIRK